MKIAGRINAQLVRELGQGIDPARMLTEPLYARDVLLVCEALPGTELAELGSTFRQALQAAEADHDARNGQPSGFSPSRFLNSLFGHSTGSPAHTLDTPEPADRQDAPAKPPRGWFGRPGK